MQPSFFEGTEKKLELSIERSLPSWRDRGDEYWARIVRSTGAEVVSTIANDHCRAFLLSESSLFVFDHKLVMITCGRTRLPVAVTEVLKDVPADKVEFLVYERKNEVYPHGQPTSFFDDVKVLHRQLPGKAYQFGDEDEHHLYLFHLLRPFAGHASDVTLEILMYGIDSAVLELFDQPRGASTATLRERTGIDRLLPGFELDDHLFEPRGYSLNAIRDDQYWTVHVTPDPIHSYASFETNHRSPENQAELVGRVLEAFRPRSFDLVTFDQGEGFAIDAGSFQPRAPVVRNLSCGYEVRFLSYFRPPRGVRNPIELPVG
jgi:S-adenosylmethionine decarboxylase